MLEFLFIYSVKQILVIHNVDNLSDHEPIILDLELNLDRYEHGARSFTSKSAQRNVNGFKRYQQNLSENLHNIALPASALLCRNPLML